MMPSLEDILRFLYQVDKKIHVQVFPCNEEFDFLTNNYNKITLYYSHF